MSARRPRPEVIRGRGDAGAALVEAALMLPVVTGLVLMLLDFAVLELVQTQVSSAARDGARAGIITWQQADAASFSGGSCPTAPSSVAGICRAARDRLAGTRIDTVGARCFTGQTDTVQPCSSTAITPGVDTMVVTVTATSEPTSLVTQQILGRRRTISASARMVLQ